MTHLYNLPEPFDATVVVTESRYEFPTKARWVYIMAYGAGAGGGGGASGAINTQRGGGAGGQAGICNWLLIPRVMCPSAIWISPGVGGAGGAADTDGTNGTFTNIFIGDYNGPFLLDVYAGARGNAGTAASGGQTNNTGTARRTPGYYLVSPFGGNPQERSGTAGGNTGQPSTIYYSNDEIGGSGGGGGAGCPAGSYTPASGGAIITIQFTVEGVGGYGPTIGGGLGNATQGGDGIDGYYQQLPVSNFNGLIRSYGGTGGGNSNSGTGGRGGNGAIGAGGGGGGAGFTGGAGGRGGNGYAIICWW